MKKKIACPECERGWCLACNNTGVVNGDPGMRKVVNLATNYMSALCETGAGPGRFDRFPAAEDIGSPEDCARVLNKYFL